MFDLILNKLLDFLMALPFALVRNSCTTLFITNLGYYNFIKHKAILKLQHCVNHDHKCDLHLC